MEWIYNLIPNYGWDIIIFTIVIRLLSIPLQLNQQKSMACLLYTSGADGRDQLVGELLTGEIHDDEVGVGALDLGLDGRQNP